MKRKILYGVATLLTLLPSAIAQADVVSDWNAILATAMRNAGIATGSQTRPLAIMHAAIFDAVNGIARKYDPYFVTDWAPGGARQEAAAAQAAYTTLVSLIPSQKAAFDAQLALSLASIPGAEGSSESIRRGVAWGERVALEILAWRFGDGSAPAVERLFAAEQPPESGVPCPQPSPTTPSSLKWPS